MKTFVRKTITYILRLESKVVLWRYQPKVVGITGSVGKTSTKDAVYAALSPVAYVRKSEKSYNSEIGLPLTVLGLPNAWNNLSAWIINILKGFWLCIGPHKYPKWLVLEVGIGKPGDMERTASWLKTDAVIMTAIGKTPVHIEFFNSRDELVAEKKQLIQTLKKEGLLILNMDDETVLGMKEGSKHRIITYGFNSNADISASGDSIAYDKENKPEGVLFHVDESGKSLPVVIDGVFGRNHIYASLAALALASGLKLNMLTAIESLKNYEVPPGRMRLLRGVKNSLIIDDSYNSSPVACEAALQTQKEIKFGKRKIAILGDMLELGHHTREEHRQVGKLVKDVADILIIVGLRAKAIKEGAKEAGMQGEIFEFLDARAAGDFIKNFIQEEDLILVKGSQGMRMERIVETILEDPSQKNKLLVRQDAEWLKRA